MPVWVRLPPPGLVGIEASFNTRGRAGNFRRGVDVGKGTFIYNELPRSAWYPVKLSISNLEVRADFFHFRPELLRVAAGGDVFHLFRAIYEPSDRFEPQSALAVKSGHVVC
jgi:hypothetical protein